MTSRARKEYKEFQKDRTWQFAFCARITLLLVEDILRGRYVGRLKMLGNIGTILPGWKIQSCILYRADISTRAFSAPRCLTSTTNDWYVVCIGTSGDRLSEHEHGDADYVLLRHIAATCSTIHVQTRATERRRFSWYFTAILILSIAELSDMPASFPDDWFVVYFMTVMMNSDKCGFDDDGNDDDDNTHLFIAITDHGTD